jgi:hypothetical protein
MPQTIANFIRCSSRLGAVGVARAVRPRALVFTQASGPLLPAYRNEVADSV